VDEIFRNPILPGFSPDPSICRVGEDYYLVNSSFEYFPGLPLFHGRDLVHWRQIGHVMNRPSQLNLDGIRPSGGLYAPTIRYHRGAFYVINTFEFTVGEPRNFIVTAADPAGPWSEPHWLDDAPGIDPSLHFNDDGHVWYVGNREVPGSYYGHNAIWAQELDLEAFRLVGEKHILADGALKGATWAEGPHIYKIDGMYFLMVAEGGTGHDHAVTVFRSQSVIGPYESNPRNPILTHRHLGQDYPIVGPGHADLVQTSIGEWWLVCLAMRPYGGYFFNLGRETFMVPVRWEEGWPVVSPGTGRIEFEYRRPGLPECLWPVPPACDNFEAHTLAFHWNFIRTPREQFWSLVERIGYLRLRLRPQMLSERCNPSFVGRRQQHIDFVARVAMEFSPREEHECAGLVLIQSIDFHFLFIVTQSAGNDVIKLVKREKGADILLAEQMIPAGRIYLRVQAIGQEYSFFAAILPETWKPVAENVDGRILSTPVAGGYVGAYIGMYASSNGRASRNFADFDWFEYKGISN